MELSRRRERTDLVDTKVDIADTNDFTLQQTSLNPSIFPRSTFRNHQHLQHLLLRDTQEPSEFIRTERSVQSQEGSKSRRGELGFDGSEEEGKLVSGGIGEGGV